MKGTYKRSTMTERKGAYAPSKSAKMTGAAPKKSTAHQATKKKAGNGGFSVSAAPAIGAGHARMRSGKNRVGASNARRG